jgi:phenylacetaldehyde dehydrogenase
MPATSTMFPVGQLFIGGQWRDAASGGALEVIDPSNGSPIGSIADADASDVSDAVAAARHAFEDGPWRGWTGRDRAEVLLTIADLVREHGDELAERESRDVGKPLAACRRGDINSVANQFAYCASLAQSLHGSTRELQTPAFAHTRREPYGVVGAITPFNFPLVLSGTKIAPALAAGNVIVHKPAEEASLSALLMAQLMADAGLPDGVYNLITGLGSVAGDALIRHPGIDKLTFTGSSRTGKRVAAAAAENLIPVTMELGGNASNIVFDDVDIDRAVSTAIRGFVFNTGQYCMAGTRLLVASSIYDRVLAELADRIPRLVVGDPRDPATDLGPMAAERHRANVERYVQLAREDGGRIVVGGEARNDGGGFYYLPTVIADLPNDSRVIQEEIFGPVLTVQQFDTEAEAVAMANSTVYGLASGLQTRDLVRAHRVAAKLDAGMVWINTWSKNDASLPFGGVKQSGYGRESGPEVLESYTRIKSVVMSLE